MLIDVWYTWAFARGSQPLEHDGVSTKPWTCLFLFGASVWTGQYRTELSIHIVIYDRGSLLITPSRRRAMDSHCFEDLGHQNLCTVELLLFLRVRFVPSKEGPSGFFMHVWHELVMLIDGWHENKCVCQPATIDHGDKIHCPKSG